MVNKNQKSKIIYISVTIIAFLIVLFLIGILFHINFSSNYIKPSTLNKTNLRPILGGIAPNIYFKTINGKDMSLNDFKGQNIIVWFVATWCSSCSTSATFLQSKNNVLKNTKIIILETYNDAGYRGESLSKFIQDYAPKSLNYKNWFWSNSNENTSTLYNPKNYPDIYYLINKEGKIIAISSSPVATFNSIQNFISK